MKKDDIQKIPVVDSPHNDAFEAIVELYYQILGYITSSGKWFWVWESGKKQRGYQDIDVLAIGKDDMVIVSVTSCLDDKFRFNKENKPRDDMLKKLESHFDRIEKYLSEVPEYQWLTKKNVKRVVAYANPFGTCSQRINDLLKKHSIELVSAEEMLHKIEKYIKNKNIKIQNQMLRTIQVVKQKNEI
ncbi:MAG: hypothetical protein ABSG75_06475 [Syntrophales bacterium]|jgi:hypothetical protein